MTQRLQHRLRGRHPYAGIHDAGQGRLLFVATAQMLATHEASKPAQVCKRAGIPIHKYCRWSTQYGSAPELRLALYGADFARARRGAVTPVLPAGCELPEWAEEFRRESSPANTIAAAGASCGLVRQWLRRFPELPWLEGYLLRAEEPPPEVSVPTLTQVEAIDAATDYLAHCRHARPRLTADQSYVCWWACLREFPPLLLWLFGGDEPEDVFIVDEPLRRLREEGNEAAVASAAGFHKSILYGPRSWRTKDRTALDEAMRVAETEKVLKHVLWRPSVPVDRRRQQAMWKYARSATLAARLNRAGMRRSEFEAYLTKAQSLGVEEVLRDYLNWQGAFGHGTGRVSGLLAENFFVPWPGSERFRAVAQGVMNKNRILTILNKLPGARYWFLARASLRSERGMRAARNCSAG